jgi:hypothetical protein
MDYYCNICKKPISKETFRFSMNKYRKPLCDDHQQQQPSLHTQQKMSPHTKTLQSIMKKRKIKEEIQGTPENQDAPRSIKDWINADMNTWDHLLKKKRDG